ncbi:MAG TPA: type II toxin-antitoxin system HicA family toxin [Candidatus Hydrogenedentes bacterium]|nr:type II toxin-antitoxin system HicA family toxin [Candidatus Hydrogenedentota bacterium]HIJ74152.1 type II toxin-antitoxin system HicA family toxin [Candidatus Hydrogenedentota bacterium]
MSRLPSLAPRVVVAALKRPGFEERRQRGSHLFLWHPERESLVTVPMHARDLPRGTLKTIIRQAGLTEDEFQAFL